MQVWVRPLLKPAFIHVKESEAIMKLPYGYVQINEEIVVHEEKADAVRSIFGYYLAGASLGKIVDMLYAKGIPIVGVETYMDAQFEREHRCNVDYDKAGHPRKATRYQSPSL